MNTTTTDFYTLSLHDALPILNFKLGVLGQFQADWLEDPTFDDTMQNLFIRRIRLLFGGQVAKNVTFFVETEDRKSTRLNSSHRCSSYAVFCLKKKKLCTIRTT